MKRTMTLAIFMAACAFGAQAQLAYQSFAMNSKVWEKQIGAIKEYVYGNHIDGDTIINGETWKKVYNYVGFPDLNHSYYTAVRDVGLKVYAIAKGSNRARLLYDFGLQVGDMVGCGVEGNAFGCLLDTDEKSDTLMGFPFVSYLKVERIDTIESRGIKHRFFTFSLLNSYREYYMNGEEAVMNNVIWVEGVGSAAGPFSPWMPLPSRNTFIQSCEINGKCVFNYQDLYKNYESNAIISAQSEIMKSKNVYDLQGRRLNGEDLPKGIYIQGGKKRIIR